MSSAPAYSLFETPIGACGIAWTGRGVAVLQLPERERDLTSARMLKGLAGARPATPSAAIQVAIDGIVALLEGEAVDLRPVMLDQSAVPPFNRRVYAVAREILAGTTLTYGEIAVRIGEPAAARSVGQALGSNPFAIIVPCHRVLAAGGRIGGFSGGGGALTKRRILAIEQARIGDAPDLFDDPRSVPMAPST